MKCCQYAFWTKPDFLWVRILIVILELFLLTSLDPWQFLRLFCGRRDGSQPAPIRGQHGRLHAKEANGIDLSPSVPFMNPQGFPTGDLDRQCFLIYINVSIL
jgi:hypothetical protein